MSLACALLRLIFQDREAVVLRAGVRLSREEAGKIVGCGSRAFEARTRNGFARLAEILPGKTPPAFAGETASCRALSGMGKAIELQQEAASGVCTCSL